MNINEKSWIDAHADDGMMDEDDRVDQTAQDQADHEKEAARRLSPGVHPSGLNLAGWGGIA